MSSFSGAQFEAQPPLSGPPGSAAGGDDRSAAILFNKARDGDRAAFGQVVAIYQDRLFNALLRMMGDPEEARELTQETFARGLEKLSTFRGEAGPYTWLFRIGVNLAISQLRKDQRRRTFSLDGLSAGPNGDSGEDQAAGLADRVAGREELPPQAAERRERQQVVLDCLGKIDPEYRVVLIMRDVEGFDYAQMADVLEVPLGTLKSRLFRARLALRDELTPYWVDGHLK